MDCSNSPFGTDTWITFVISWSAIKIESLPAKGAVPLKFPSVKFKTSSSGSEAGLVSEPQPT